MSRRLPLYVLLASALAFLASLFLPWRETQASPLSGNGARGVLDQVVGPNPLDGWITGTGDIAVLLVIALVLATAAALRRPQLSARLPIGSFGVALGYFAAAVALQVRAWSRIEVGGFTGHPHVLHTSWSYGFYLGLASGAVAAMAGLAWSRNELRRPQGTYDAVAGIIGVALLISFLLPWVGFQGVSYPGIENAAASIAALGLMLGAPRLHDGTGRPWRLPCAIATAILTGAAASGISYYGARSYGVWIGICCAALLVVVETVRIWPLRLPDLPHGLAALRTGASAMLIVALFLPWKDVRGGPALDGWSSVSGAVAGSLCLLLLATPWLPAMEKYALDAAVAITFLVSALAAGVREAPFVFHAGYGAYVGIAAAGTLLISVLVPLRPGRVDRLRALPRAAPLAASVLCVAAVVLPWWFVLPGDWSFRDEALFSWLSVPGLLLGLYLVRLWVSRMRGPNGTGYQLVLVPLVLLTLAALELIRFRESGVIWAAVILVGLCLLLMLLGWIEEDRGLETFRVPEEMWRIDRLPGAER